jgi:hypothetical protein
VGCGNSLLRGLLFNFVQYALPMSVKHQWASNAAWILAVCLGLFVAVGPILVARHYKNIETHLWKDRYTKAAEMLARATTDHDRFYPLTELAKSAFYFGQTNDARDYAQRLLAISP